MAPLVAEQGRSTNFSNFLPSIPEGESNEPTIPMVQIGAGQWHSLEVLEEGVVIFEAKDGAYAPLKEIDLK